MRNTDDINAELNNALMKAEALQKELDAAILATVSMEMADLREAAASLHDLFCPYNHTDGCSWGYEEVNGDPDKTWRGSAHMEWLQKTKRLLTGSSASREKLTAGELQQCLMQAKQLRNDKLAWRFVLTKGLM